MTTQRTLLLSLRPRFADSILTGTKTVEIRRRPINAASGTPIILYASSPLMAVVGTARLAAVHVLSPNAAWRKFSSEVGLTRAEFDAYLDGTPLAYMLALNGVNRLNEPLPLRRLRASGPFQPPQSFRYIAPSDPSSLKNLVGSRRR
jgi:predicted transcriptional regulator